jgi:hypothetical protein
VEAGRQAMRAYLDQPLAAGPIPTDVKAVEAGRGQRVADRIAMRLLSQ